MAKQTDPLRKRISAKSAAIGPAKFLLGCVVLIFIVSIFLQVGSIEVTGNTHYTSQEVIQAAGIEEGDNLFFINRFSAVSGIMAKLPYVESVEIATQLPGTVIIEITESQALAWVELEGQRWIIDRSCKVLTQGDSADTASLIRVSGLTPVNPSVGDTLVSEGDSEAQEVTTLAEMLDQIQRRGLAGTIDYIDLTDVSAPVMSMDGRFTVLFGSEETIDYQFGKLVSAVSQLTSADRGTLDISAAGEGVTFSPF